MSQLDPQKIFDDFIEQMKKTHKKADLLNLKAHFLGKTGPFAEILKSLKDASIEVKRELGQRCNHFKVQVEQSFLHHLQEIEKLEVEATLNAHVQDISFRESLKSDRQEVGGYHPLTLVQRELEDIFLSMGFEVLDGPYIEDEYHNFEALNVPADHPARDMQDTFWFADHNHLLRTQTSTIQVRGMKDRKPPFKFIGPGKVFRCERIDASHEAAFHQMEGMVVQEELSVAHLIYFMKTLLKEIFKREVEIRLRPGFFPFVEPGFELDIRCLICQGKGCAVCKKIGWLELLPCGLVHPNVLKYGGLDPEKYQGLAFGLGLDRLVMMRYVIDDIRLIHSGDLRFISQFRLA